MSEDIKAVALAHEYLQNCGRKFPDDCDEEDIIKIFTAGYAAAQSHIWGALTPKEGEEYCNVIQVYTETLRHIIYGIRTK